MLCKINSISHLVLLNYSPTSADLVRLARLPDEERDKTVLPDLMKWDSQREQRRRSRVLKHKRPLTAGDNRN